MNGWTPNPNDLRQILELLHSSQTADNEVQKQVQEKLQQLNQYPDFHYYLAIILSASLPEFGQQEMDYTWNKESQFTYMYILTC